MNYKRSPWPLIAGMLILTLMIALNDVRMNNRFSAPRQLVLSNAGVGAQEQGFWQWEHVFESAAVSPALGLSKAYQLADSLEVVGNWEAADLAWSQAVEQHPSDAPSWGRWGRFALKKDQFSLAQERYELALSFDSLNSAHWINLGVSRVRQSRYQSAIDAFVSAGDYAVQNSPRQARATLNEAITWSRLEDWSRAEPLLLEVVSRSSGSNKAKALTYLGQVFRATERDQQAIEVYQDAIALAPSMALPRLGLAQMEDDPLVRAEMLGKLIKLQPGRALFHFVLAETRRELGDHGGAESAYKQSVDLLPEDDDIARGLMQYYLDTEQQTLALDLLAVRVRSDSLSASNQFLLAKLATSGGHLEKAVLHYDNALASSDGELFEAWLNRGVALKRLGRVEEAISSYSNALEVRPSYPEAWFNIALAHGELGDYTAALKAYLACIDLEPNRAKAHYNLGVLYTERGDIDLAISSFQQAVLHEPSYRSARFNLAVNLQKTNRLDEAELAFDSLNFYHPTFAKGWHHHAALHRDAGRLERAQSLLASAVEADPVYVSAWFKLGLVYASLGETRSARQAFEEVVGLNPQHKTGRYNLGLQLEKGGEPVLAATQFERAWQLDHTYLKSLDRLESIYEKSGNASGLIHTKDRLMSSSTWEALEVDSMYGWARALHRADFYERAVLRYDAVLRLDNRRHWSHYWRAKALESIGDLVSAFEGYQRAIAVKPGHKFSMYRLALVARDIEPLEAGRLWSDLEALYPDFAKEKMAEQASE